MIPTEKLSRQNHGIIKRRGVARGNQRGQAAESLIEEDDLLVTNDATTVGIPADASSMQGVVVAASQNSPLTIVCSNGAGFIRAVVAVESADVVGHSYGGGVAQWLLNNFVINSREDTGAYRSLDKDGLEGLLERHRQQGISAYQVCFASAEQNVFATATKTALA